MVHLWLCIADHLKGGTRKRSGRILFIALSGTADSSFSRLFVVVRNFRKLCLKNVWLVVLSYKAYVCIYIQTRIHMCYSLSKCQ